MKTSDWIAALSFGVSFAALLLSFIGLWRTRKTLYVRIEKKATRIKNTFASDEMDKIKINPFDLEETHIIFVSLINPSATPISYFGLEVTDKERHTLFSFPVQSWLDTERIHNLSYMTPNRSVSCRLLVPNELHGSIAPNDYKVLMLAINGTNHREVYVSLKITKFRLFKSRKHSKPERWKTVSQKVTLG